MSRRVFRIQRIILQTIYNTHVDFISKICKLKTLSCALSPNTAFSILSGTPTSEGGNFRQLDKRLQSKLMVIFLMQALKNEHEVKGKGKIRYRKRRDVMERMGWRRSEGDCEVSEHPDRNEHVKAWLLILLSSTEIEEKWTPRFKSSSAAAELPLTKRSAYSSTVPLPSTTNSTVPNSSLPNEHKNVV